MSLLRRLFSDLGRARPRPVAATGAPPDPRAIFPELEAHARAPIDLHVAILFGEVRIGARRFEDIMRQAIEATSLNVPPLKAIRRREAALNLICYFRHARTLPGRWAECGVFAGTSSLALCLAARAEQAGFDGSGLHLVDSYEGLSELRDADMRLERRDDGSTVAVPPPRSSSNFAAPIEMVREAMSAFGGVRLHKGWIPQVLGELPEDRWSFVHVDVDLHAPTLACLEYFYPRMSSGGIIACDDFGSPAFPGARRAWEQFCSGAGIGYVALPTGQSVLVKP
jgi:O-methyltransferase